MAEMHFHFMGEFIGQQQSQGKTRRFLEDWFQGGEEWVEESFDDRCVITRLLTTASRAIGRKKGHEEGKKEAGIPNANA